VVRHFAFKDGFWDVEPDFDPIDAIAFDVVDKDRLAGARTVGDLIGEENYEDWQHGVFGGFVATKAMFDDGGWDLVVWQWALIGLNSRWWGHPRWPDKVAGFFADEVGTDTPPGMTLDALRAALLDAPETLSVEVLQWCVDHTIAYVLVPGDFLYEARKETGQ
jgi:hypothetical protein